MKSIIANKENDGSKQQLKICKQFQNYIHRKIYIMNSNFQLLAQQIFQTLQPVYTASAQPNEIFMIGRLNLNQPAGQTVLVELTPSLFTIKNLYGKILCTKIDFTIKFEVILQNENNIKSKKKGFKIFKEGCSEPASFFCQDNVQTEQWISGLRRYMNQLGFHKKFKAIRKLGKGQFATVFQVQSLETGQRFAVKAFSKNALKQNPAERKMESLINEIKIMRTFRHKNLLKLQGVFESDNSVYLVIELLKGGSLFQRIQKLSKEKRRLSIDNIRELMAGLINGLAQLNEVRIAHRDLKLDNIVLRSLDRFQPVIIDFGLGTFVDDKEYIYYRCGTAGFVSPQVINSTKTNKIGPESDIFSVGAVFHYLLTYRPLFEGRTTQEILLRNKNCHMDFETQYYKQIDLEAMDLLKRMLVIDSSQRIKINQAIMHQFLSAYPDEKPSPVSTVSCQDLKELQERLSF